MADEMIPIHYSGFWDIPMAFITVFEGKFYLFDRGGFDEELDDYPPTYKVFLVTDVPFEEAFERYEDVKTESVKIAHSVLYGENNTFVGEVSVGDVKFDETNRRYFDPVVLRGFFESELSLSDVLER